MTTRFTILTLSFSYDNTFYNMTLTHCTDVNGGI